MESNSIHFPTNELYKYFHFFLQFPANFSSDFSKLPHV